MARLGIAVAAALLFVELAGAQTTTTSDTYPEASSGGTPGSWVEAAIARHEAFITARVNSARSGGEAGVRLDESTSSSSSSSTTDTLTSLLSSLGGTSGLTSLLSGLTGSSTSTTTGSTSEADAAAAALQNLIALRDAASGSTSKVSNTQKATDTAGGAIARLPKAESRTQSSTTTTTDTTTRSFGQRLVDSWSQAFFAALTVGFQSTDFVTMLEDAITPIFYPSTTTTTDNSSGSSSDSVSSVNDLTSPSNDGSSGNSTL